MNAPDHSDPPATNHTSSLADAIADTSAPPILPLATSAEPQPPPPVVVMQETANVVAPKRLSTVAMIAIHMVGSGSTTTPPADEMMQLFSEHPAALWVLIMPGQLAILVVTALATILSPEKFAPRLGIQKPTWPLWTTAAAVLAAPICSFLWSIPLSSIVEDSEHLNSLNQIFSNAGQGFGVIGVILCVGLLPSLAEEWLFRGYVQSRLQQRWSPFWAILVSSILFAGFHMDPVHIIAILPLGLWLGLITYKSGSLIPAMLAHFYNNSIAVLSSVYEQNGSLDTSFSSVSNMVILALGIPAFIVMVIYLFVNGKSAIHSEPRS